MTNNYERTPNHINSVYADLKTESKYLLTKKDARAVLLVGFSVGCFMLAATLLLAYAVMLSTSINNDEYQMQQALVVYASIWMGIFLMLPGIYCGMYTSLLKISAGQRATASDLFGYYTSPRMFFRSIGIFVRGNWFLLGIGVVLMLTIVSLIFGGMVENESLQKIIEAVFSGILLFYLAVGSIAWIISRKRAYIFIPYAVENSQVSLKECARTSKNMNMGYFNKSYPNDLIMTILWLLLSVCTVGILFVLYLGPMMMAKKVSFYRSSMVNKFI